MGFWKSTKPADAPRIILARIEGTNFKSGSVPAMFFLLIGAAAMAFAVFVETNTLQLVAWGTIWTGWNVLFGIGMLNSTGDVRYVVYRENPPA